MEDFMHGRTFADLGLNLVRTNRLHQFRPRDYPVDLLRSQDPARCQFYESPFGAEGCPDVYLLRSFVATKCTKNNTCYINKHTKILRYKIAQKVV
jgi:hypothetical protein